MTALHLMDVVRAAPPVRRLHWTRQVALPILLVALLGAAGMARAGAGAPPGASSQPAGEATHDTSSPGGWIEIVARLLNFAILAAVLVYVGRSPLAAYVRTRGEAIRRELARARELQRAASEQMAAIEAQLQALPAEIERLRARGLEEIAAEERRIRELAETERRRLLEQTRREIEWQLRIARRSLMQLAAERAVAVAAARIQAHVTPVDQERLVARYLDQLGRLSA